MIPTSTQMSAAEQAAFRRGVTAESLMESAGRSMADLVTRFHPRPGTAIVFHGKGHNGGDVLVAARHLAAAGWGIQVEKTFADDQLAPLTAAMLALLESSPRPPAPSRRPLVVLDGLLGIGTSGPPREPVAGAIRRINDLRTASSAWVLAADLPSGLGTQDGERVLADATIAMGFAKSILLDDNATNAVGRLAIAPLEGITLPPETDPATILTATALRSHLPPRSFDFHKGMAGRVAVVAGSPSFPGAARLCSAAAVKGGAGLITLFTPREILPTLAASCPPEVMVATIDDIQDLASSRFDAIAIGPGLGRGHDDTVRSLAASCPLPMVIDADALNAVAGHNHLLREPPGPRLLTPHPGEMERLSPRNGRTRRQWLEDFTSMHAATLLLKGARTAIGQKNTPTAFNQTGHPGMATGGMGDILTGLAAALLAQHISPFDAASIAAWTAGRAAESAVLHGASQESLTPTDLLAHLGHAFSDLRNAHP